jgi:hypothetical protein
MIQIDDWVALAIILAFFALCICYLGYFVTSRKLHPKMAEFQKEVVPNTSLTLFTIDGPGIIKKIEMQNSENSNLSIVMVIDRMGHTTLSFSKEVDKEKPNETNGKLKLEVNLDAKFRRDFSLFIDNRNGVPISSTGRIFYETKKP